MLDTRALLIDSATPSTFPQLRRESVQTLQVNLGYLCNLSCTHCHVNAGPKRIELMDRPTVDLVLDYLRSHPVCTLDLTGGAPEMNPHFRYLVEQASELGIEVIDRSNLTILCEPAYEDMATFLAKNKVVITASLPCYSEQNVERQRGKGVFQDSISALQTLNALGYGRDPELKLNLVYNPDGLNLPPAQAPLEADYKRVLLQDYGIVFNQLFTITNMPIRRFGGMLLAKGLYAQYMDLLCSDRQQTHLAQLLTRDMRGQPIVVGEHCYGCTAGQGSSCGGALSA